MKFISLIHFGEIANIINFCPLYPNNDLPQNDLPPNGRHGK